METSKSKNLILILLFIVLIINISMMITFFFFPSGKSQRISKEKRIHHKENMKCLMNDMDLTKEQEEDFFILRDAHRTKIELMFDSVKVTRNLMIDAIVQEPALTTDELNVYADRIGSLETEIQKETIDYFMKMKQILDKEQFGKLIDNFRDVCGCSHFSKDKQYHKKKVRIKDTCPHNDDKNF